MLSQEDLIRMLHHVQYEIRYCMLIPECREDAHMLKEAIFLSFFVHARVLIHFFEDTNGQPDDVFSADFDFLAGNLGSLLFFPRRTFRQSRI